MAEFTLDTSGVVTIPSGPYAGDWTWERVGREGGDFTQGHIEALFASYLAYDIGPTPHHFKAAFSDLAGETLERIMEDCHDALGESHLNLGPAYDANNAGGHCFWLDRQAGLMKAYPPQTPYLDDGKVYLRSRSEAA